MICRGFGSGGWNIQARPLALQTVVGRWSNLDGGAVGMGMGGLALISVEIR